MQAAKADRLFDVQPEILVTDVVLAETVWTLAGKRYNVDKRSLVDVIMGLLAGTQRPVREPPGHLVGAERLR